MWWYWFTMRALSLIGAAGGIVALAQETEPKTTGVEYFHAPVMAFAMPDPASSGGLEETRPFIYPSPGDKPHRTWWIEIWPDGNVREHGDHAALRREFWEHASDCSDWRFVVANGWDWVVEISSAGAVTMAPSVEPASRAFWTEIAKILHNKCRSKVA